MSRVSAVINMGATAEGVPSLGTFLTEMEFFKRLGLRREELADRPAQEIKDYCFFIEMIQRKEAADQAKQNHRGSGPSTRG